MSSRPRIEELWAHTPNDNGEPQLLRCHLLQVAELAEKFASAFNAGELGRITGLLHDVGKYGDLFQRRLKGNEQAIDHWTPGAYIALKCFKAIAAALAIQGHHVGLQESSKEALARIDLGRFSKQHSQDLRLSECNADLLIRRLEADGLCVPEIHSPLMQNLASSASAMLDLRMLYSALVDADFLDTERHFTGRARPESPSLQAENAFARLADHIGCLKKTSNASEEVKAFRTSLLNASLLSADKPPGLWTLTAPTGSGKTLAMLAFALKHALKNQLRRIVVVIPFLNIIEQTAHIYRTIFQPSVFGENYVLEHHSLSEVRARRDNGIEQEDRGSYQARLLTENWDAPIIITTSVQMLESLFSNRPSACRKLHRLAQSVILFDEVQTLPNWLIVPTLATLAHLSKRYKSSVVFSTATQPAFTHLDEAVSKLNSEGPGWKPREIASLAPSCLQPRTKIIWPDLNTKVSWQNVACELATHEQVLCIVNLKRHARELWEALKETTRDDVFHLSAAMCPAHRTDVINKTKQLLKDGSKCRLISTQCIEAGVDIDFTLVYRAFADLASIAQAAGRCNRNGRLPTCNVHVFIPEDEAYPPDGGYEQAAEVTKILLRQKGSEHVDINDPKIFEEYYRLLYDLARPHDVDRSRNLECAIVRQSFVDVAATYRLISCDAINVLVPYEAQMKQFLALAKEVTNTGLRADWIRRAQPLTVSLYRPKEDAAVWQRLEPIRVGRSETSDDWFIYREPKGCKEYSNELGLIPPDETTLWLA